MPLLHCIGARDEACEALCLQQILLILTTKKINGTPVVGVHMELVLSCNGAMLGPEFLKTLGKLGTEMDFRITVDEILTCGRCSETKLLLVQDQAIVPKEFLNIVSHVTMGKWGSLGIVLCKIEGKNKHCEHNLQSRNENYISVSCAEKYRCLKRVVDRLSFIGDRRSSFLDYLEVEEKDTWDLSLIHI